MVLGILLACLPWGWRNYTTFGTVFFIRSNLNLELRVGNSPGTAATIEKKDAMNAQYRNQRVDLGEAHKLRDLGEIEYMNQARDETIVWIKKHPVEFASLTAQRFTNLWIGPLPRLKKESFGVLAVTGMANVGAWLTFPRISIPKRTAFLIPLLTYPLIYYIVAKKKAL